MRLYAGEEGSREGKGAESLSLEGRSDWKPQRICQFK